MQEKESKAACTFNISEFYVYSQPQDIKYSTKETHLKKFYDNECIVTLQNINKSAVFIQCLPLSYLYSICICKLDGDTISIIGKIGFFNCVRRL